MMIKLNDRKRRKRKLANQITAWLLLAVVLSCAISVIVTGMVISSSSEKMARRIVRQNVEDVCEDIHSEISDTIYIELLNNLDCILSMYPTADIDDPEAVSAVFQDNYFRTGEGEAISEYEVNIVNADGIVVASSIPEHVGLNIADDERLKEYLVLLDGTTTEYTSNIYKMALDGSEMAHAGIAFPGGSGFIHLGIAGSYIPQGLYYQLYTNATYRRIGDTGYFLVCGEDMTVIGGPDWEHYGENLSESGIELNPDKAYEAETFQAVVYGTPAYVGVTRIESYYLFGIYPKAEIEGHARSLLILATAMEVIVFGLLFVLLSILLRRKVVKNIVRVNDSLHLITGGNLEEKVEVRESREFDSLSDDINATVDRLKGYIAEAAARIDKDLAVAKAIQTSILPSHFPAFPDKKEFELYAGMKAAKEVGGDFYDFFMVDESTLGFVIADVSGKSIPGAMFMMRGKTVFKELALRGLPPGQVMTAANQKLCEGNDARMFVTAWMGFLDIRTGVVRAVNAGHNPPMLIHGGQAEYLKLKPSLIMGTFGIARYKEHTFTLVSGDMLFLYTDGVTEAEDAGAAFYGEERLQKCLSFGDEPPAASGESGMAEAVCRLVETDLAAYTEGADQSDDITMLCIRYIGR